MNKRLIIVFLLIVTVPLVVATWLGLRSVRNERERENQRYQLVLESRLRDIDARVNGVFLSKEVDFQQLVEVGSRGRDEIRSFIRKSRLIKQVFIFSEDGALLHPPSKQTAGSNELDFYSRIASIGLSKDLLYRPTDSGPVASFGWYTWFWGAGVNFIFWQKTTLGSIIGFEVARTALIADIISALPDTPIEGGQQLEGRMVLVDTIGNSIYQWGAYKPFVDQAPSASISVSHPLSSWRLHYFVDETGAKGAISGRVFPFVAGMVALVITVVTLAVYFYRESAREMNEALQRMSFVNQVSHELKTPLTNIRMYAELLEDRIPREHADATKYMTILVSESNRLSRLISNVLTFAKSQKSGITIDLVPGVIDRTISDTIERFRPALDSAGIEVEFTQGAAATVYFDGDLLDQILNNLISNVEKYASSGRWLGIASAQGNNRSQIRVDDRGPGIPHRQRRNIFKPFYRISNKLTDGVAGTGIGLSIAKNLAVSHGGSLDLVESEVGASFIVNLNTPVEPPAGVPAELPTGMPARRKQ